MELMLYTRPGCHLCEEAKTQLQPLLAEFGLNLREVNVDSDAALAARFGEEVPVVFLDGRKLAKYRVDLPALRRALERFRRNQTPP